MDTYSKLKAGMRIYSYLVTGQATKDGKGGSFRLSVDATNRAAAKIEAVCDLQDAGYSQIAVDNYVEILRRVFQPN